MSNLPLNEVVLGNCLDVMKRIPDNSIHLILTDPPYFLDKLDNNWSAKEVADKKYHHTVTSLPAGMKFSKEQGKMFYDWYLEFSKEAFRILKPGATMFSFSSPRLYHRMVSSMDDAGFEIRDAYIWLYTQNQVKAMSMNHIINRLDIPSSEKIELLSDYAGWKTPQIKSCYEPIGVGIKPLDDGYLNTMMKHEVGLYNTNLVIGNNMQPSNVLSTDEIHPAIDRVFLIPKPTRQEKRKYNTHKTVKPLLLCEHLIRLTLKSKSSIVLDPFGGSGTTLVAAKRLGHNYIGIELNQEYIDIANQRLSEIVDNPLIEND